MSILIKNGRVVTAAESYIADVYTEGEKIIAIGKDLPIKPIRLLTLPVNWFSRRYRSACAFRHAFYGYLFE